MLFQFGFKTFKKGEGVGCAAGEAGDDVIVVQAANLTGIAFHDGITHADLTIPANHDSAVAPNRKNSGAAILFQGILQRK